MIVRADVPSSTLHVPSSCSVFWFWVHDEPERKTRTGNMEPGTRNPESQDRVFAIPGAFISCAVGGIR